MCGRRKRAQTGETSVNSTTAPQVPSGFVSLKSEFGTRGGCAQSRPRLPVSLHLGAPRDSVGQSGGSRVLLSQQNGADAKEKRFPSDAVPSGEQGVAPCLRVRLLRKPGRSLAVLGGTRARAGAQNSCSTSQRRPWEPAGAAKWSSGGLACSQLLSGLRVPPGGWCGAGTATGHAAAGATRSGAPRGESG